jgi:multiple sugar transport system permease protein
MKSSTLRVAIPLLAPVHLLLISVVVIPAAYVIWLSFQASSFGRGASFVGLDNYVRVITDPAFHSALWNTVVIVVVAVHLEMVVALGMALLFASGLKLDRKSVV